MNTEHKEPSGLYKEMIGTFSSLLKESGFVRRGTCFYLSKANGWGLVEFQKSRKSTADQITFTVNLGVCSRTLLDFFSSHRSQKPSIETCHWRQRLGFLLSDRQDKWWVIEANDGFQLVVDEVKRALLSVGIPEIQRHLSDQQLCDDWLAGKSPGLTDTQRLINLSVLLEVKGDRDTLQRILQELDVRSKGRSTSDMVQRHLRRLRTGSKS
jgi:hypothetical protein